MEKKNKQTLHFWVDGNKRGKQVDTEKYDANTVAELKPDEQVDSDRGYS